MNDKKRLALALAAIFALNIIIIMLFQSFPATTATYWQKATGPIITQIQHTLEIGAA